MMQRSETDHNAMSKEIDQRLEMTDHKCEEIEKTFKSLLDLERQTFTDMYSDHAAATKNRP